MRRPFQATPIRMGRVYRLRADQKRRKGRIRTGTMMALVAAGVFAMGMLATNADKLLSQADARGPIPASEACHFLSVHDGDTIRCGSERLRVENIDAPELEGSPRCEGYRAQRSWCDYALGLESRDALKAFLKSGPVRVARHDQDRYGRTLAVISVNGQDAGEHLVSRGLARWWQ